MDDGYIKNFRLYKEFSCVFWLVGLKWWLLAQFSNTVAFLEVSFGWVKLMVTGRIVQFPWLLPLSFRLVRWLFKSYFAKAFGGDSTPLNVNEGLASSGWTCILYHVSSMWCRWKSHLTMWFARLSRFLEIIQWSEIKWNLGFVGLCNIKASMQIATDLLCNFSFTPKLLSCIFRFVKQRTNSGRLDRKQTK